MKIRLLIIVAILGVTAGIERAGDDRPNVLFIMIDDLANVLGPDGDRDTRTPNLDALAARGVSFERAYCQLPLCNPSRASLLTGLRPDAIRVYDLDRHFRDERPEVVTLPQLFRRNGWFSARVGKIFHYDVPAGIGTDGLDDPPSWDRVVNPKGRDTREEDRITNPTPSKKISAALCWLRAEGGDEEQTDGLVATEAIRLMEAHRDGPFFLGVGFFRPHTPYVAPTHYFEMVSIGTIGLPKAPADDRDDIPPAAFAHNCPIPNYGLDEATCRAALQAYHASVSFVDAQVGRVIAALDRLGLASRTIVVACGDHGYHLGEHGGIWQKRSLFEESARAPLIVVAPSAAGNGRPCRRIVEFVGIYPTLADLCGLEPPEPMPGRSLQPLLDDPSRPWDGEAVTQVLRPGGGSPIMGRSLRTDRWRYTEWNDGEAGAELYDHDADPGEFINLARTPAARPVVGELKGRLESKAEGRPPTSPVNPERL